MSGKSQEKPVRHLVLDSSAIIEGFNLHNLAEKFYAPYDVRPELVSAKAKKNFEMLPFEVEFREPTTAALKAVFDAAKKMGEFKSLSLHDSRVIALTYDLTNEFIKKQELTEPSPSDIEEVESALADMRVENKAENSSNGNENGKSEEDGESESEEDEDESEEELENGRINNLPEGFCEASDSDDEKGWITKDNLAAALRKIGAFEIEENMEVACLTKDFALQNILLAMDLRLASLHGYRIKKIKSYVLRCRACMNTTNNMEKEFCPSCGHKMLHKCAVTVEEDGTQTVHVNWQRLNCRRGLKYHIKPVKGGKHAMDERLFEDQRMPQNREARLRADPMCDSPFKMHDTQSKSALLGIRTRNNRMNHRRGNPNEAKRGMRKKK
ncbi:hypothetical protein WR25_00603 [Diploscapter pachys]|uniref:RNA-binding protein NOB1 n=1 Tax=Diploscapter pachys TaxID=2018661 RepID=A0A2A2KHV3_9BILA|nr:hypothetical protein WR25_00603 [Diploscapter pachys]